MPCEASGYPQPSITWSRNGRPITELLTEPHIATDRNNSLNVAGSFLNWLPIFFSLKLNNVMQNYPNQITH